MSRLEGGLDMISIHMVHGGTPAAPAQESGGSSNCVPVLRYAASTVRPLVSGRP
jgi:hypothetical protein